ncbi:M36 family metallopeptidase [Spongiactinospora sp. 9N601]|uniref:M36 family metallopeptidase n=1 Tax=Spongiactinospora sp. 9N601 TaxID=3375149 RepID=UPI00379608F4
MSTTVAKPWLRAGLLVATGVALALSTAGVALSEPGTHSPKVFDFQGEEHGKPDVDNRRGFVAPPATLDRAGTTVRWNSLGTPAVVTGRKPLAEGLGADPEQAARAYLKANEGMFGLPAAAVDALEKVAVNPIGKGHAVLLRQRFGGLPAGVDGMVAVGVFDGSVVHVTSTLSRETGAPPAARITARQAEEIAARDGDVNLATAAVRKVTEVAVPAPDGIHSAFQVTLAGAGSDGGLSGVTTHVDGVTGAVLVRENQVDHAWESAEPGDPRWEVFPANPPADYSSADTRKTWCFKPGRGCDFAPGGDPATGKAWDVDHTTDAPANTSLGNAARTFEHHTGDGGPTVGTRPNVLTPSRDYRYPWKNAWHTAKCDPAVLDKEGGADLDAAIANLHAMHNRMHDWSYRLGFTETAWNMQSDNGTRGGLGGDPETGNAQAGARVPNVRDNANQYTGPDGTPPITNMFLWQPIAGAFYAPCVDGDFDMSVIGHEYTHAISGRMVGGPNAGWNGPQASAMNESTSDLFSMEYLFEYGFRPAGDTPYVTGGYVTGDRKAGIRNFDMSRSPLNYSDLGYDLVGTQSHADGEIWSATQFDVRQAFIRRYGDGTPAVQRLCADGKLPIDKCPGNRRWVQLAFDALLLMASGAVDYVDHRDAMLAADTIRFGGKNHDIMWNAFAEHGLGKDAASDGPGDAQATPSFAAPDAGNATVTLAPRGDATGTPVRLYVGDFEARAMPIADTDPATPLGDTFQIVPGTYSFVAAGPGLGHARVTARFRPGQDRRLGVELHRNLAAAALGATASGDGVNHDRLIDGTEATNWASLTGEVRGKSVIVDLAGTEPARVRRVQVSAMLRPLIGDEADPFTQNRFSALRSFEVLACDAATGRNCADPAAYTAVYKSRADAFSTRLPRPRGNDLLIKSFGIRPTTATHLLLRVGTTQCTGNPLYLGEQDADPANATDCATTSATRDHVRAAEFQAFTR